jgi:hypothetical protein
MPPVQLKNTLYGKHRLDPNEPAPKVVLPWDDEPVDEIDTDSSPKDIESTQPPED